MKRDPQIEHEFLVNAAREDGDFVVQVAERLEIGQRLYGDEWQERKPVELVGEALEEAVDLAAWSALVLQRINMASGNPKHDRLVAALSEATYHASRAYQSLLHMRRQMQHAKGRNVQA